MANKKKKSKTGRSARKKSGSKKLGVKKTQRKVSEKSAARKKSPTTGKLFAEPASTTAVASLAFVQKTCLPLPDAIKLVRSCSNAPDNLPLSTPLGQIFPSATARDSFCQCIADGVPINRAAVPCGAGNTLQDVVDAIAC